MVGEGDQAPRTMPGKQGTPGQAVRVGETSLSLSGGSEAAMGKPFRGTLRGGPAGEGVTWVRWCPVRLGAEPEGSAQASS